MALLDVLRKVIDIYLLVGRRVIEVLLHRSRVQENCSLWNLVSNT